MVNYQAVSIQLQKNPLPIHLNAVCMTIMIGNINRPSTIDIF